MLLGGLRWDLASVSEQGRVAGLKIRQEKASKRAADLMAELEALRAEGIASLRKLADALNEKSIPTARGGTWSAVQVQRVLGRG